MSKTDMPTKFKGISAHLTYKQPFAGGNRIRGYLFDEKTGTMPKGCKAHQITVRDLKYLEQKKSCLVEVLSQEYERIQHNKMHRDKKEKLSNGIFTSAVLSVTEPSELLPGYSDSTFRENLSYFKNEIAPRMDKYGYSIQQSDLNDIFTDLVKKAIENKRSKKDVAKCMDSVGKYWYFTNTIYRNLRIQNVNILPDLNFVRAHIRSVETEQCKSLPEPVRVKLSAKLLNVAGNGCAMGAALMYTSGLRTSEAAAVKFKDIIDFGEYCIYPVLTQIYNKKSNDRLKTDAAYRIVIFPYFMRHLLGERKNHLTNKGYTDQQIDTMYVAASDTHPFEPLRPNMISAYTRRLLNSCGIKKQILDSTSPLMTDEPDLDSNGKPTIDINAYILRRDWCTRAFAICGMTNYEINYLMGHAQRESKKQDFTSVDAQRHMATELERYVYSPDFSFNPKFKHIEIENEPLYLELATEYNLVANNQLPTNYILQMSCSEPGENLILFLPPNCTIKGTIMPSEFKDIPTKRDHRAVIGHTPDRNHFEKLV